MCGGPIIPDGAVIIVKFGDEALFNKNDLTPEIRADLERKDYYLIERGAHIRVVPNNHPDAVKDLLSKGKDLWFDTVDYPGEVKWLKRKHPGKRIFITNPRGGGFWVGGKK